MSIKKIRLKGTNYDIGGTPEGLYSIKFMDSTGQTLIAEFIGRKGTIIKESSFDLIYLKNEYDLSEFPYIINGNAIINLEKTSPYLIIKNEYNGENEISIKKSGSPTTRTVEVSLDNGSTWTSKSLSSSTNSIATLSNLGDEVWIKGNNTSGFSTGSSTYYYFSSTQNFSVKGSVMSLCDNGTGTMTTIPNDYCFNRLFYGCSNLISITSNFLLADELSSYCYNYMFYYCNNLVNCPRLPATTLEANCYEYMFYKCSNLITLPKLSATVLKESCYRYMFAECSKIKISATKDSEYTNEYRIPYGTETGTTATYAITGVFSSTGGTTKDISLNTTYYTSNEVV